MKNLFLAAVAALSLSAAIVPAANAKSTVAGDTNSTLTHEMLKRLFTVKTLIRAAFTVLSLSSIGIAHSQSAYHAPAHNYHQNNWMAGGGG